MRLIEIKDYAIEGKLKTIVYDTIHFGTENGNDKDVLYIIPSLEPMLMHRLAQEDPNSKFIKEAHNSGFIFKHYKHDAVYLPVNTAIKWLGNGTSPVLYNLSLQEDFYDDVDFLNGVSVTYNTVKSFIGYASRDSTQAYKLLKQDVFDLSDKIKACRKTNKKIAFSINYYDRALELLSTINCEDAYSRYRKDNKIQANEELFTRLLPRKKHCMHVLKYPNNADFEQIEDLSYKERVDILDHVIVKIDKLYGFLRNYNHYIVFENNNTIDMLSFAENKTEYLSTYTTKYLQNAIDNKKI